MKHEGIQKDRLQHNLREAAFAEQWRKENELFDVLQILMQEYSAEAKPGFLRDWRDVSLAPTFVKVHYTITPRDEQIVATVIQWLGSNVGFSFLEEALNRCGFRIAKNKT